MGGKLIYAKLMSVACVWLFNGPSLPGKKRHSSVQMEAKQHN